MLKSVNKSDKRGCTVQYPGSILRKYDVALCVIVSSEPFRTVAYSVEQEQLLDDAETENLLSDVRCLLINFRSSDERYFAAKLIKTVSVQTHGKRRFYKLFINLEISVFTIKTIRKDAMVKLFCV